MKAFSGKDHPYSAPEDIILNTTILSKDRKSAVENSMHRVINRKIPSNPSSENCVEDYKSNQREHATLLAMNYMVKQAGRLGIIQFYQL